MPPPHPTEPLADGVVSLAPLTADDAERASKICDIDGLQAMEPNLLVQSCQDINSLFLRAVEGWHRSSQIEGAINSMPRCGFSVVKVVAPDDLIGMLGFQSIPSGIGVFYWIAPAHRGQQLATQSLVLGTAWALTAFAVDRIQLRAANPASEAVALKAGYARMDELHARPLFQFKAARSEEPRNKN
jgi:RimJ/RimL family protein N-acetyltransferase